MAPQESMFADFLGARNGKYFGEPPAYVDKNKKPGYSPLPKPTAWDWVRNALLLKHIWASPNAVWGAIALAFYFYFPYDLSKTGTGYTAPLSLAFFKERFPLWFAVTFGYNFFFHATIYGLDWAKRPFLPGRTYNIDKVAHNIFWSTSGIAIWVGFENVFVYMWSRGLLPYMSDQEAFADTTGILKFIAAFIMIPLWREGHFYFAHRLLHIKPLYAMVHSLHHRNTDIEPFAGLSMHPVEHLYYYACIMPSFLPFATPFLFLWNGMHLVLSPGASHSGYEDHMQSDAFHYMHHRYFECNYAGFGAASLDVFFGTFVGSFAEKEKGEKLTIHGDGKSTLRAAPTFDFVLYLGLAASSIALWAYAACVPGAIHTIPSPLNDRMVISLIAGFGPVLAALPFWSFPGGTSPLDRKTAPEFHVLIGSLVCSVPVVMMAWLSLALVY